jgi:spore germination protein Q
MLTIIKPSLFLAYLVLLFHIHYLVSSYYYLNDFSGTKEQVRLQIGFYYTSYFLTCDKELGGNIMSYYQPYRQNPYGATGPMQQAVYPQFQQMPQAGGMQMPTVAPHLATGVPGGMLPTEQSYIENILRINKGKLVTVYATFENNNQWNAKTWKGVIEAAGRDHLIISDPETGQRLLLPMVYLDFVTFSEEIDYSPDFGGLATFPPRD